MLYLRLPTNEKDNAERLHVPLTRTTNAMKYRGAHFRDPQQRLNRRNCRWSKRLLQTRFVVQVCWGRLRNSSDGGLPDPCRLFSLASPDLMRP